MNLLLQSSTSGPAVRPGFRADAAKILYADDDPIIRKLSERTLAMHGYSVTLAEDGARAWEALQDGRFDLLITDNNMPRMSGLEVIDRMRRADMEVPVILASGYVARASDAELEELRLAAALPKPFAPDELLDAVEHALNGDAETAAARPSVLPGFAESRPRAGTIRHWGINE